MVWKSCCANSLASSSPMPLEAPVTTASWRSEEEDSMPPCSPARAPENATDSCHRAPLSQQVYGKRSLSQKHGGRFRGSPKQSASPMAGCEESDMRTSSQQRV